jgi:hypothetical protein
MLLMRPEEVRGVDVGAEVVQVVDHELAHAQHPLRAQVLKVGAGHVAIFLIVKLLGLKRPGVGVMITIFCDFHQFSAIKLAFFLQTNVMIHFCGIQQCFATKTPFFHRFIWRKYFSSSSFMDRRIFFKS